MKFVKILALVALAAALAAQSAAASGPTDLYISGNSESAQFESSSSSFAISGTQDPYAGITKVLETGNGWEVKCTAATYSSDARVYSPASSIGLWPHFEGCTFGDATHEHAAATVETGTCKYGYSSLKEDKSIGEETFSAAGKLFNCIPQAPITITSGYGCTLKISTQALNGELTGFQNHTDPSSGKAVLFGLEKSTNVKYTTSGFACLLFGMPAGSYSDGTNQLGMQLNAYVP
jgi:hypothetical protein